MSAWLVVSISFTSSKCAYSVLTIADIPYITFYSYSFYASRNILLVHKLKEIEKEHTGRDSLGAHDNVTRSFSTVCNKTIGGPTHI
jgi:hypothetical protein